MPLPTVAFAVSVTDRIVQLYCTFFYVRLFHQEQLTLATVIGYKNGMRYQYRERDSKPWTNQSLVETVHVIDRARFFQQWLTGYASGRGPAAREGRPHSWRSADEIWEAWTWTMRAIRQHLSRSAVVRVASVPHIRYRASNICATEFCPDSINLIMWRILKCGEVLQGSPDTLCLCRCVRTYASAYTVFLLYVYQFIA